MKKIVYVALLLIAVLIFSGCGNNDKTETDQEMPNMNNNNNEQPTTEELNQMAEDMAKQQEIDEGTEENTETITGDTMEYCSGGNSMITLKYSFANKAVYKFADSSDGEPIEQLITETENCASAPNPDLRYSCVPIGANTFEDLKSNLKEEKEALGMAVGGLSCNVIAYDESIFAKE